MNADLELSELYCRYNGFMAGVFLGAQLESGTPVQEERWSRLRSFLREIGADTDRIWDIDDLDGVTERVLKAVLDRSGRLSDFALLGRLLANYGFILETDDPELQKHRDRVQSLQSKLNLPPIVEEPFRRASRHRHRLNAAIRYLTSIIREVDVERTTAFVAQPFKEPFGSQFETWYRPLLADVGKSAVRAWGGISGEEYLNCIVEVIRRCRFVLADVSGLNPNVIHEVGIARGAGVPFVMVADQASFDDLGANLLEDLVVIYRREPVSHDDSTARAMPGLLQARINWAETEAPFDPELFWRAVQASYEALGVM